MLRFAAQQTARAWKFASEHDRDSVAALSDCGAQIDVHRRAFHRICGAGGKPFQRLVRGGPRTGEKLAFGPEQLQLEDQLVAALRGVFRCRAGDQIFQR
jgi:hypothetical protein